MHNGSNTESQAQVQPVSNCWVSAVLIIELLAFLIFFGLCLHFYVYGVEIPRRQISKCRLLFIITWHCRTWEPKAPSCPNMWVRIAAAELVPPTAVKGKIKTCICASGGFLKCNTLQ